MSNETENENIVPESNAINGMLGSPSLDADPVESTTLDLLDSLLDSAEGVSTETAPEIPEKIEEDLTLDEVAPVPVEEVIPEVAPEPIATPEVEIDPEISSIPQPRNLSEANQNNWKKLQETATNYKKQAVEAEQLRQKVQELEQRPSQMPPDYDELKKFRAIFDTENDPDFKSKYDVPIASAKENIYNILKKNGASDDVINSIESAGGPDKISQEWWKSQAIDKLPMIDAERLKKDLFNVIDLKEGRTKEIGDTAEKRNEFLQSRQTELVESFKKQNEEIYSHTDELTKEIPWARYKDINPNDPPEIQAEIQKHNATVQDLSSKFEAALWPKTPQERADVAAAASGFHVVVGQLRYEQETKQAMQAKVEALTKELTALKNAGRMPKANPTPANAKIATNVQDRIKMNASDAIDLGLDEASGF
jgi:uncharacterized cupin superfamily protein